MNVAIKPIVVRMTPDQSKLRARRTLRGNAVEKRCLGPGWCATCSGGVGHRLCHDAPPATWPVVKTQRCAHEVRAVLEIGEQAYLLGLPAEPRLRERARRGGVEREERAEPAEVLLRDRLDRQAELATDHAGDVARRDALVAAPVEPRAGRRRLERGRGASARGGTGGFPFLRRTRGDVMEDRVDVYELK
ncbi:hypothetical protein WMF18_13040 [Sorangium sp. So ce315]|uniref:hypothetical protein n=1 Tax=Sorangium sp. So ce315 TaxID=3133299 RepID=UPI003F5DFB9E